MVDFHFFQGPHYFGLGPEPAFAHEGKVYVALLNSGVKEQRGGSYLVGPACKTLDDLQSQINTMKAELDAVYVAAEERLKPK